jgi:hypothetical protein
MKKINPVILLLALTLTTVFLLSGCSKTQSQVSGQSLFPMDDCERITFPGASLDHTITEQKEIDEIVTLFSSLTLKSLTLKEVNEAHLNDLEGGIVVIVSTPKEEITINVSGEKLRYDGQWYKADEDIGRALGKYIH